MPWAMLGVTVAGLAVAAWLAALNSRRIDPLLVEVSFLLALVMSTAAGIVLATRRGENPIGWLLLANGLVLAFLAVASEYANYAVLEHPGTTGGGLAALVVQAIWPLLFAPLTGVAFVFPDGHLPSRRWRPIAIASAVSFVLMLVLLHLAPRELEAPFHAVSSPLPQLPEAAFGPLFAVSALGMVGALFAAAFAVRTRLRRATGVERQSSSCSPTRPR